MHNDWTDEELVDLEEMYVEHNMSAVNIAVQMHKTYSSVKHKIYSLRLRHKRWYEKHKDENMEKPKVKPKKARPKASALSYIRPFTFDSDMLIVQFMDEDGMDYREISEALNRDMEDTRKHIEEIEQTGLINKIREYLTNAGGMYAVKMKGKLKKVI